MGPARCLTLSAIQAPLLHLHEIHELTALEIFDTLFIPQRVAQELDIFKLPSDELFPQADSPPVVETVSQTDWHEIHRSLPDCLRT